MDIHNFYKENYFFELDRKNQLANALTLPIGVLTVLLSALVIIGNSLDKPLDNFELFQLTFIVLATITLFIAIGYIIVSLYNYTYGYIATNKDLKEYYEKNLFYIKSIITDENEAQAQADLEFKEHINNQYAEYTDINIDNNDKKSRHLHMAHIALTVCLVFTIISGVPYVISSIIDTEKIHKIEVVNFEQIKKKETK